MEITVATYNIQHGRYFEEYLRSGREVSSIPYVSRFLAQRHVDICAFNEVVEDKLGEGWGQQARQLAEPMGYHYQFARAIAAHGGDYGNAIISRFPIRSVRSYPIAIPEDQRTFRGRRYEDRVLLVASLATPCGMLTAMVCHFGLLPDENALAAERILSVAEGISDPIVLMGDFNLTPESEIYEKLCARFEDSAKQFRSQPLTFPSDLPNSKIDYIFTGGACRTLWSEVADVRYSDHRPILARLQIGEDT